MENKNCYYCDYCNSCYYCYYCNYCNYCDYCDYCNSCNSCNSCNYCYSCNYCNYCNYCKNLKMTEHNLFCYSKKLNDNNSFQQKRYRAFNKEVGEVRYFEILNAVRRIMSNPKQLPLTDFWKSITSEQWEQLLAIPEATDFKDGFEYISGVKIEVDTKRSALLKKADELIAKANELKEQANNL